MIHRLLPDSRWQMVRAHWAQACCWFLTCSGAEGSSFHLLPNSHSQLFRMQLDPRLLLDSHMQLARAQLVPRLLLFPQWQLMRVQMGPRLLMDPLWQMACLDHHVEVPVHKRHQVLMRPVVQRTAEVLQMQHCGCVIEAPIQNLAQVPTFHTVKATAEAPRLSSLTIRAVPSMVQVVRNC
jgi:hypothetical protein